jgi:hypothetical protein
MKKGYYDVKHESLTSLGSGWSLALDGDDPGIPADRGALRDELPGHVARKRAEAARIYPPAASHPKAPPSGSARLLNAAFGAARRTRTRHQAG